MSTALTELRRTTAVLREAIFELVMTVHEDRPLQDDGIAVDHVAEVVSELQASVMDATENLNAIQHPWELAERLPEIDDAIAVATVRYWRDLRAHGPLADLRVATRRWGGEWRTWQQSVEQSELRCEEPLLDVATSVRGCWREIGELLTMFPPRPATTESVATTATDADSTSTRRTP